MLSDNTQVDGDKVPGAAEGSHDHVGTIGLKLRCGTVRWRVVSIVGDGRGDCGGGESCGDVESELTVLEDMSDERIDFLHASVLAH